MGFLVAHTLIITLFSSHSSHHTFLITLLTHTYHHSLNPRTLIIILSSSHSSLSLSLSLALLCSHRWAHARALSLSHSVEFSLSPFSSVSLSSLLLALAFSRVYFLPYFLAGTRTFSLSPIFLLLNCLSRALCFPLCFCAEFSKTIKTCGKWCYIQGGAEDSSSNYAQNCNPIRNRAAPTLSHCNISGSSSSRRSSSHRLCRKVKRH